MELRLTQLQARQFFVLWQGLSGPRRWKGQAGMLELIHQLGCIQFDPIDVCGRNADLVLQARVQGFRKGQLETQLYRKRSLIEYQDKNMAIFPAEDYWGMSRTWTRYAHFHRITDQINETADQIRKILKSQEYVCSKDLDFNENLTWMWGRDVRLSAAVLEVMYYRGELLIHHRKGTIRYYSLVETLFPQASEMTDPHPQDQDYFAWRVERRIRALGLLWNRPSDAWLGIEGFKSAERRQTFDLLLAQGRIMPLEVEGFQDPLYCVCEALELVQEVLAGKIIRRRMEFLGPLDNCLWDRKLIRQLFDFDYKWEIYTPEKDRKYGYYVLPVLWGPRFVGRIDLNADSRQGTLEIRHFWREPGVRDSQSLRRTLSETIERFAKFHQCPQILDPEGVLKTNIEVNG